MREQLLAGAKILNNTGRPSLPFEVIQLQEALSVKYPNTVTISSIINKNPELLALFLKTANMNVAGKFEEMKSSKQAVENLGLDKVNDLFMSTAVLRVIANTRQEAEFLGASIKVGIAAAEIAHWVYEVDRSEAYMAGILCDIGALFLNKEDPSYLDSVYKKRLVNPYSGIKTELNRYQTAHEYISVLLAKDWGVKPVIYKSILMSHQHCLKSANEDKQLQKLVAVLKLALYSVLEAEDESYITQELKDDRTLAMKSLEDVPGHAMRAAIDAVKVYGNKIKPSDLIDTNVPPEEIEELAEEFGEVD